MPRGEFSASLAWPEMDDVDLVVDQAFHHRAIARIIDELDVILGEAAEGDQAEQALVHGRRAHDPAHALALQILDRGVAEILGNGQGLATAGRRRQHELQGLRAPFLAGEFQHALLGIVDADAHGRGLRPTSAQRAEACHVVAGRQHAQVGAVFALEHLPDGDGLVEGVGAGFVGRQRDRCGKLDVLCRRAADVRQRYCGRQGGAAEPIRHCLHSRIVTRKSRPCRLSAAPSRAPSSIPRRTPCRPTGHWRHRPSRHPS